MKRLVLSGLAVGAAMAIGTARAEQLTLSADQMDQVTAAGFDAFLDKAINVQKNVSIQKVVEKFQDFFVAGFFGEADAFANCLDAAGRCQAGLTETFSDVISGLISGQLPDLTVASPGTVKPSVSLSAAATTGPTP
jgi:hypothetical protein